jgi:tetratricopeptide (TPR) repeat protein
MSESPNKMIRFWQELKRRKTGKIIIAYAATAFILLQLADILTPALLLPEWTTRLITLILIIGFPIAVIFSWVFDITPEGIKKTESIEVSENKKIVITPVKRIFKTSNIIIVALIIVVGILAYPKIFKRNILDKLRSSGERISVAVMPFQNMTNDTIWDVWQDGIQINLITSLSNNPEELQVRQTESITNILQSKGFTNYASITPSVASGISQKLDADVFIIGTIKQAGTTIRVNAQLIDSRTKEVFKSFEIDGPSKEEAIFDITDSLRQKVTDFLIISKLQKQETPDEKNLAYTNSPSALRYFIYGNKAFNKWDMPTATKFFLQAIDIDSNFYHATLKLSIAYMYQGLVPEGKKWCLKLYEERDNMSMQQKIWTNYLYATLFETLNDGIQNLRQLLEIDDQQPFAYFRLGDDYNELHLYDNSVLELEKSLDIYKKWDIKPQWIDNYTELGDVYHKNGQYKKERKLYKKAGLDFPNNSALIYRQTILSLSESDTIEANKYINRYISLRKENSASEAVIATNLAAIYSEVGNSDKAEEYYRIALSLEPESLWIMNNLAYFLIDKDRNINEGLELADKALVLNPENYNYLYTKGWGLFKQGKYQEALDILQKSWDLRMKNAIYDHEAFLHLEAAKKAVANLK